MPDVRRTAVAVAVLLLCGVVVVHTVDALAPVAFRSGKWSQSRAGPRSVPQPPQPATVPGFSQTLQDWKPSVMVPGDKTLPPTYNAFVFAVADATPTGGATTADVKSAGVNGVYFRAVEGGGTQMVLGALNVTAKDCTEVGPPISPGYEGAISQSFDTNTGSAVVYGGNSAEHTNITLAADGVMIVDDGPIQLRFQLHSVVYEFRFNDPISLEAVVYREVLGTFEGVMFGQSVSGWGGFDAYFGTYGFGGSSLFNDVEEDWMVVHDTIRTADHHIDSRFGLVVIGIRGFSGGYMSVSQKGTLLVNVTRSGLSIDEQCGVPKYVNISSVPPVGSFVTTAGMLTLEDWGNWTMTNHVSSWQGTPLMSNCWWEHHPPRSVLSAAE